MSRNPSSTSRRVVSGEGNVRVVLQKQLSSGPSSFANLSDWDGSFVDKTLAIEAFLRDNGSAHLVLRPRRCGKSYTLSMIGDFLRRPLKHETTSENKATRWFSGTAIMERTEFVSNHFQQYPVLHIDLKDVHGLTYEDMVESFDEMVENVIRLLSHPYSDLRDDNFCADLRASGLQELREQALLIISMELRRVYMKGVVVLIDEYDAPMHAAIEHGYATQANDFFSEVFGSLLKSNDAVYASMMVGLYRIAISGWLSSLNNVKIFPMHAEDDRYANSFLFTEQEVEILCNSHGKLSAELLRPHYNGYAATSKSGLVKLYNPCSVVKALEANRISDYWVETGRYAPLTQSLFRASPEFRKNFDLLVMQKSVKLVIDEHLNFSSYNSISDSGLWGLMYYTGYLTIEHVEGRVESEYVFRIPNREVTSQYGWVRKYLVAN